MKALVMMMAMLLLLSCQQSELVSEFTGNETVYALLPASEYPVSGEVILKERKDGTATVLVELTGTNGTQKFPVHLHLGDITTPDADIAALLSPVDAQTGKSETVISALADETKISYQELIGLWASIKVHLDSSGPGRDVILAAGNIGSSASNFSPNGRFSIGVCSSN